MLTHYNKLIYSNILALYQINTIKNHHLIKLPSYFFHPPP